VRDYVIRNAADMYIKTEEMNAAVLLPASPSALMDSRKE